MGEPLQFVGLANLRRLISDPMASAGDDNNSPLPDRCCSANCAGILTLAVLVNRSLPGIHILRGAFYTPVLVSIVVAAIAFRWLYAENGLVNGWLVAWFGEAFSPIGFLTTPQLALPAVMLVTLWKGLGYYMVIFLAGLQGIPKELYEAAELDGSEGWRQHLDITLPLLRPYVALVAVVSSIAATKVFEEVYLMTQRPGRLHQDHRLLRLRPGFRGTRDQLRLHARTGTVPAGDALHPDPSGFQWRPGFDLSSRSLIPVASCGNLLDLDDRRCREEASWPACWFRQQPHDRFLLQFRRVPMMTLPWMGPPWLVTADPRDVAGTRQLVEGCSGITFENEWVNIDALIPLEQQGVCFRPSLAALSPLVDKLSQRQLLADLLIEPALVSAELGLPSSAGSSPGLEFSCDGESSPGWIRRKGHPGPQGHRCAGTADALGPRRGLVA